MSRTTRSEATDSPLDPERLRQLFEEALARFPEEGLDAANLVCQEEPDFAPVVRRRLEMLGRLGLLEETDDLDEPIPERLGDFRLEEKLGGGGMGVVFRAWQESLERPVALKLIHPEHLYFPQTRERFRREVQTLAMLRHPGVVPVHAGGDEGGVPYFAMELVEGLTMAEVLDGLRARSQEPPSPRAVWDILQEKAGGERRPMPESWQVDWPTWCLQITRSVADAIDHAHQQGILHRDLKPSNFMMSREGRVLVIDFGLATTPGTSTLTRSGSFLGSLPYMSPEQIEGRTRDVDLRSDVYALGITLYEMLTLRLPYSDPDASEVRRKIIAGERRRPRQLLPSLPKAVETIALVASEPARERRYPTMAALRADIDRWLSEKSIEARLPGLHVSAGRWCSRHPLATAALLVLLLGAGGWPFLSGYLEETVESRTAPERAAAAAADDRARQYFREIVATFDGLLERIETDHAEQFPDTAALRRQVFQQAVAAYGNIEEQDPHDPLLRRELGRSFRRLARIEHSLGDTDAALASFQKALDFLSDLHAEFPGDDDLVYQHALCLEGWASLQSTLGRDLEVVEAFEQAIGFLAPLIERHPDRADYQALQVSCLRQMGHSHYEHGRPAEGRAALEAALKELHAFEERHPNHEWVDSDRSLTLSDLGYYLLGEGRVEESVALLEEAKVEIDRLLAEDPGSVDLRRRKGRIGINLAGALSRQGEAEGAAECLRETIAVLEQVAQDHPSQWLYGLELASAQNNLGLLLDSSDHAAESKEWLERCLETLRQLGRDHPDVPVVQARLGASLSGLADTHFGEGDFEGALVLLEEARVPLERARSLEPSASFMILADRNSRWLLALTQTRLGRPEEAAELVIALMEEPEVGVEDWQRGANYLTGCFNVVQEIEVEDREAITESWIEKIVEWLRRARSEDQLDQPRIETADDYELIRREPSFQAFLAELREQ